MSARIATRVNGSGPDVLLLHGQPGSAADWTGVAAELSASFRVIVPDRPGWGETAGKALGIVENADALVALLDELGSRETAVAGHSWGAGVALALAERQPARVRALVLVCPVTPAGRLGAFDRALAHPRLGPAATRAGFWAAGSALATAPLQRFIARALPGLDHGAAPAIARAWRRPQLARSFYREQRALFDELPALRDGLPRLAAPVSIVIGTHDRITEPSASREFAAWVGARLTEVPRAGHMLPMQAPREVAEAIAEAAASA